MSTVFVIDNDRDFRELVCRFLEHHRIACRPYASGESFLAEHRTEPEGCVIIELHLQGGGGLELQTKLNDLGWELPQIFLSRRAEVEDAVDAIQGGAVAFLRKPFEEEELLGWIRECFGKHRRKKQERHRKRELQLRFDKLSHPEKRVLHRLIDGEMNKVVARKLEMGLRTVVRHRVNALKKLGVESIPQAVRVLYDFADGQPFDQLFQHEGHDSSADDPPTKNR